MNGSCVTLDNRKFLFVNRQANHCVCQLHSAVNRIVDFYRNVDYSVILI